MPRTFVHTEPEIINRVEKDGYNLLLDDPKIPKSAKIPERYKKTTKKLTPKQKELPMLQIATTNKNKLKEFERLIPTRKVEGVSLKGLEEIQSLDPFKVAEEKAKKAFELNSYNPILVEDVSLDIKGLNDLPGTLATFFISDPAMREKIAREWLKDKDRRATARTILAIFDGKETFMFEGTVNGTIADEPRGGDSFGFDDIFIPREQSTKNPKTFAEMNSKEKDKVSMRARAAEKFISQEKELKIGHYVYKLPEPFESELQRVQKSKLNKKSALKFAYSLEATYTNKPNKDFTATKYEPLYHQDPNIYYDRYVPDPDSASIGIVLTDIDKANIKLKKNGDPVFWQMGPERREMALAQRAEYFLSNTDPKLLKFMEKMEKENYYPNKVNKRHATLENLLRIDYKDTPFYARAVKELGYKKLAAEKQVSRRQNSQYGLINKVGKYPRLVYGLGSMPAVSCWRDSIVTAAIGHIPVFTARNNIFASNDELRIKLINQAKEVISNQDISSYHKKSALRNVGAALGSGNPLEQVKSAELLYKNAGVTLFRVYGINSDPRFVETAIQLRKAFGNEIEIFAGQLVDKDQGLKLIEEAQIDGIVFGHGGGRQCTSATNGMALTTLEEVYSVITDERFNSTSVLVEGGVGHQVGGLLVLGIDAILFNQQFTRGTIETGGVFVQHLNGEFGQPYHGSASAPTMIIEAASGQLRDKMLNFSGRTKVPEGKKGFTSYAEKANSMAFWIDEFKHQAARTLADLGVSNMHELRNFVAGYDKELLRIVSSSAAETSKAWGAK